MFENREEMMSKDDWREGVSSRRSIYEVLQIYRQNGRIYEIHIYRQIWGDMRNIADITKLYDIALKKGER